MANLTKWILVVVFATIPSVVESKSEHYSNEWIVKTSLSKEELRSVASRYGFRLARRLIDDQFLLIHTNVSRSSRSKERLISKVLSKENKFDYAEQLKWINRGARAFTVTDDKWPDMWYINRQSGINMNVLKAWESGHTGAGITIAIVDDGVEHTHLDLIDRYNQGLSRDFYDDDDDPSPNGGQSHGTKCAGVAMATKNNICTIGIAYQATLVGHRMIGPLGATQAGEISSLGTTQNIDILSNSWGGDDGNTFDGPSASVANAIKQGCNNGRNGKGAIYLFAGGNGGSDDDCNCDGYVNNIHTISINSVTIDGEPPGYAEGCSAILACSFSGPGAPRDNIFATDIGDGCTDSFTGTSASTPMAAGIIALLLQANPNLTWRDVQELIVRTSKSDGLKYGNFKSNAAGWKVSDLFGYGLLDSTALINKSKNWIPLPEQHSCTTNKKTENKNVQAGVTPRIRGGRLYTNGCNQTVYCVNRLEHVEAIVVFSSSFRGAVSLILQSPLGTVSNILKERVKDSTKATSHRWKYMSVQFWGENPAGEWKLNMSLQSDWRQNGSLESWELTFYGTGDDCSITTTTGTFEGETTTSNPSTSDYLWLWIVLGAFAVIFALVIGVYFICKKKTKSCTCKIATNNGKGHINNNTETVQKI